jgi:hypothetical protein
LNSTVRQWVRFSWSFAVCCTNTVKTTEGVFEKIQQIRLIEVGEKLLKGNP